MENSNYARISCLLMEEGTRRAQEAVLSNLPPRTTLAQALAEHKNRLSDLTTKQRILSRSQYEMLCSFDGDMSKIDITLWLVLARNITTKKSRKGVSWLKSPEKHETLWAHDLIRLREIRNYLFHVSAPELVGEKFLEIKSELCSALRRLGTADEAINYHMTRDLDPQQTMICELQIREQYMEEENALLHEAARQKRHTRILTIVLSLLAILVLISVAMPVAWYFSQAVPCSQSVKRITSTDGVFYFMSRSAWNAAPVKNPSHVPHLRKPVMIAGIFHTAMILEGCDMTTDCCQQVKYIQTVQMNGQYNDISYSYLIGNDGVVYEGRGSQYQEASCYGRHNQIISIALIGHFTCVKPSAEAMASLYVFLDYLTRKDPATETNQPVLHRDYKLYGHCQLNIQTPKHNVSFPDSPGAGVMQEIQYWDHWQNHNITACEIDKDCLRSRFCCKTCVRSKGNI